MSDNPTLVTREHFKYITERTREEDDFLRQLKAEARSAGIPPIHVSWHQASLMQILLKLVGAKTVIEVGTLGGYSAICMARALQPDGVVHTVEISPMHAEFARAWVEQSDVSGKVKVHLGAGADVLPEFDSNSADACFLDADKANYQKYLKECLRIVRKGGLFMVDNAFAFGQLLEANPADRDVPAIRAFNDHMATVRELHGLIVPVGDGMWCAVKE